MRMHRESIEANVVTDLKIGIISGNSGTLEQLRAMLLAWDRSLVLTTVNGGVEQVGPVAERNAPQLLILEGVRNDSELLTLERAMTSCPDVPLILLSPNQSPDFLRQGMRIGLREILPTPITKELLLDAIGRIQQRTAAAR